MVEELDHRIGQILQTLKARKIDGNTITLFMSDNGPEPGLQAWARTTPYRGLKWSSLEGGNRVPCIIRWPGVVPAGKVSDEIVATIDVLPTLAHACGIGPAVFANAEPKMDEVNPWATLCGAPNRQHARNELIICHGWGRPKRSAPAIGNCTLTQWMKSPHRNKARLCSISRTIRPNKQTLARNIRTR